MNASQRYFLYISHNDSEQATKIATEMVWHGVMVCSEKGYSTSEVIVKNHYISCRSYRALGVSFEKAALWNKG